MAYHKITSDEFPEEKADSRIDMHEKPTLAPIVIPKQEEKSSRLMVAGSVSFYIVAAMTMIFANKFVLNAVAIPISFLFCQLVIAVILLQISAFFGFFTLPKIHMSTAKEIAPLIGINCTGLLFNTYCLQYVDASFYQIARGLVLPFTVFFSFIFLQARASRPTLFATLLVCIGFFAGVSGEQLRVSQIGIALGIFSSLTTSVHAIVIKKTLTGNIGGTMDLVYYNNALSAMAISPLILISGEWRAVSEMIFESNTGQFQTFLLGTAITGVFGFLLCIAGFVSIKVTSPVSHMISAAVRGVLQTFLGVSLFGDRVSTGRASGIGIILIGSIWYTYSKSQESTPPPAPITLPSPVTSSIPSTPQDGLSSRKPSLAADSMLAALPMSRRPSSANSPETDRSLGESPKAKYY